MEIIEATPEDYDEIVALYASYNFALKNRRWYNWKYFDNPAGRARPFKLMKAGNIVGAVAVIPQQFTYYGRQVTGVQTVDGLLGREVRGKGNFNHLMHFLTAQKPPGLRETCFHLSFPSLAASVKAHENAGWKKLANFSLVSCLLKPDPLFKKMSLPAVKKALDIPWRLIRNFLFGPQRDSVIVTCTDAAEINGNDWINSDKVSGDRSSDFLNWRIVENPRDPIHLLTIQSHGKVVGYAVCKRSGNSVEVTEIRLTDPLKRYVEALLRYIYEQSWGYSVDFWQLGVNPIQAALPRIGFFRRNFTGALFVQNITDVGLPEAPAAWDITYLDSDW